jgi:hypothetical protein
MVGGAGWRRTRRSDTNRMITNTMPARTMGPLSMNPIVKSRNQLSREFDSSWKLASIPPQVEIASTTPLASVTNAWRQLGKFPAMLDDSCRAPDAGVDSILQPIVAARRNRWDLPASVVAGNSLH